MAQNLSGTFNTGPNSVTSTTPAGNEDISTPNQLDYLKVRAYLYKFTPEIKFVGGHSQPELVSTATNRSAVSDLISQATFIKNLLSATEDDLAAVDFNQTDYNAFKADTKTIAATRALQRLVGAGPGPGGLVRSPTGDDANPFIVIFDSSRNSTSDKIGAINKGDFPTTTLAHAQYLLSVFNGSVAATSLAPFSFAQALPNLKSIRLEISKVLDRIITQAGNAVDSEQGALVKVQKDAFITASSFKQFKVSRFVHDLDVASLSRYDLSKFLSTYRVDQSLGALCPGQISASANLQNTIIPLTDLAPVPGPTSTRRPFFFPDERGDYDSYANGLPVKTNGGNSILTDGIPTLDPISNERVSTIEADDLITRIAMAQTLEDNGGGDKFTPLSSNLTDSYLTDVVRIEIAMRLRGVKDERKKQLILKYFATGAVDDELVIRASLINAPKTFSNNVATAELALGNVTPLGLSSGLNESQQKIKSQLTAAPGDIQAQLDDLIDFLTDPKVDGILLSDLIQKYDFFSIFVYKHEVSPDVIESVLEGATTDSYFFDKESLFMYTPVTFFLNQQDNRHFATYSPEFNGFVLETASSEAAGAVNSISVNLIGSMGLMGVTKKIYNSTLFANSVFDAAEVGDKDTLLSLYQNIYATKDPFQILTTLLESLYLLRVNVPIKDVEPTPEDLSAINQEVINKFVGSSATPDQIATAQQKAVAARVAQVKNTRTLGGTADYTRDANNNVTSFLDILSLRAFNQFGEVYKSGINAGVTKGPKHLFNMASFLYGCVMRSRRFNVRVASADQVANLNSGTLPFDIDSKGNVNGAFNPYISNNNESPLLKLPKETDGSGGSILEVNPYVTSPSTLGRNPNNSIVQADQALAWKSYFLFLTSSLTDFVADVKNGFDIINDVINSCYLELFETPGGRFIFRTPQYNNNIPFNRVVSQDGLVRTAADQNTLVTSGNGTSSSVDYVTTNNESSSFAHMITSDDITPISAEYHQTAKNLVTKQQLGYGADLIGVPIEQLYYFYSNGKAVAQYGLNMSKVMSNPNVRFISKDKLVGTGVTITDTTYAQGIFHYCRFFLEYNNLHNFVGVVSAVGDPKIQVGRTYFDIKNQKFGYISQVTKQLTVGESYVVKFNLIAVRDAVYGPIISETGSADMQEQIGRPTFRRLPEMEDFIPKFIGGGVKVKNVPSAQNQGAPAVDNFSILISIEGGSNTRALNPGNATVSGVTPGGLQ